MKERLKEIEMRLAAIKTEMTAEGANLEALDTEADGLLEERSKLIAAEEKRQSILDKIAAGDMGEGTPALKEDRNKQTFGIDSKEYRHAFLKDLRKLELSEAEKRVLTTNANSAGAAVPTMTTNKIVEKVKQYAPILDEIDLLHIKGSVTIPAEGTTVDAQLHVEGAVIDADNDTLNKITLTGYEITKLITISKSVETMSIDAFEAWLVNKIARTIANKVKKLVFYGTGTNQPQGINAIRWDESNSVTVAANTSLTQANVVTLIGLLNGGYDAGAKWYMSKKTFFNDFYPLMNTGKNNIITCVDNKYYVGGYPVEMDDDVNANEAFLGHMRLGYTGNLAEDINVTSQFVARENAYDFVGTAIFDGKVSAVEAFVKLAKAVATE